MPVNFEIIEQLVNAETQTDEIINEKIVDKIVIVTV